MRRVSINYVTFARDREWMDYSLESIRKHARGFSGVTIVVPTWDIDKFLPLESKFSTPECSVLIKNFLEYPGKGFVHHLAMKCSADIFDPSADYILHMDPDCLFNQPVTPDDYFIDGKPVLVIEPYEEVRKYHQPRFHWKHVTEQALKFDCPYETMCRHPAVHHAKTYKQLRSYMEHIHRTPFTDFVIKQQNKFPQGFGEFNTLGSFAYKFLNDEYHFWDRSPLGHGKDPESKITQMWSYTGVHAPDNRRKIEESLK